MTATLEDIDIITDDQISDTQEIMKIKSVNVTGLPLSYVICSYFFHTNFYDHYQVKEMHNKVVWRTTDLYFKGVSIVNSLCVRCRQQKVGIKRCMSAEGVCPH